MIISIIRLRISSVCVVVHKHRLNFELGPEGHIFTGITKNITWGCVRKMCWPFSYDNSSNYQCSPYTFNIVIIVTWSSVFAVHAIQEHRKFNLLAYA